MTADRGLCGGFNTNICKLAKNYFNEIIKTSKNLKIITVGTKGLDQLKRDYGKYIIKKINFKDKKKLSFEDAEVIGKEIVKLFKNKEFDKCVIFFNKFKNVISQIPQKQQVIPAKKDDTIKAQNYYCSNQTMNPHTPRVMKSLGLKEQDVEKFCTDILFPKIS